MVVFLTDCDEYMVELKGLLFSPNLGLVSSRRMRNLMGIVEIASVDRIVLGQRSTGV